MKLTERQEKRLKWLWEKSERLREENDEELKKVVILHDKLNEAYKRGQDTCASCGALFTPDPIQRGSECDSCSKHPLAFVSGRVDGREKLL